MYGCFNISMVVKRQLTEFSLFTVVAGFIPARFRIGKMPLMPKILKLMTLTQIISNGYKRLIWKLFIVTNQFCISK